MVANVTNYVKNVMYYVVYNGESSEWHVDCRECNDRVENVTSGIKNVT